MAQLLIILSLLTTINCFAQVDTVKVIMLLSSPVSTAYGYDVREIKNTIEQDSSTVICCHYYWQHREYLNEAKRPLCINKSGCETMIWNVKDSLWRRNELVKQ